MKNGVNFILIILWITILYLSGLFYFQKGFLLSRSVVPQNSSCENRPISLEIHKTASNKNDCWLPPIYKKVVVVIIDALRFDFASSVPIKNQKSYNNRLTTIDYLIKNKSNHSRLYHFWADPPSTTLQRLKGNNYSNVIFQ